MTLSVRFTQRDWLWLLGAIAFAFAFLYLNARFITNATVQSVFEGIILALTMAVILGLYTTKSLFREIVEGQAKSSRLPAAALELGVTDITAQWNAVDFDLLIRRAKEQIDVFAIYTSTWINTHYDALQDFVTNRGGALEFFFLDPDCGAVQILESKFQLADASETDLAGRIRKSVTRVRGLAPAAGKKPGKLTLLKHDFVPAYAAYRFDDTLVVTPYRQSPGRTNRVPALVLEKAEAGSLFEIFEDDLSVMRENHAQVI